MKLKKFDVHDRLSHFQNQWEALSQGCQDCINNVPDGITSYFYVFAHPRTIEQDEKVSIVQLYKPKTIPSTRMIWSPRITKPKPQTNSYLFLAKKHTDLIEIIWLLPPRELWDNYAPGKMLHNPDIWTSINNFLYHRTELSKPEKNGPDEDDVLNFRRVYAAEAHKIRNQARVHKLMLNSLGES